MVLCTELAAEQKKKVYQIAKLQYFSLILRVHIFQDQPSLFSSFFLNIGSNDGTDINNMHNVPKTWTSQLREYALWIVERRKSSLPISQSQEIFLAGKCYQFFNRRFCLQQMGLILFFCAFLFWE